MDKKFTPQEAVLELKTLQTNAEQETFEDVLVDVLNWDVPAEVATRLEKLWETTKVVGGETLRIGKIVVLKIVDFVKAHPNLTTGIALGAAVGGLVGLVPWIGPMLQPLAMVIGAVIGGVAGSPMDEGSKASSPLGHAITVAREFFALLANILNAIWEGWAPDLKQV